MNSSPAGRGGARRRDSRNLLRRNMRFVAEMRSPKVNVDHPWDSATQSMFRPWESFIRPSIPFADRSTFPILLHSPLRSPPRSILNFLFGAHLLILLLLAPNPNSIVRESGTLQDAKNGGWERNAHESMRNILNAMTKFVVQHHMEMFMYQDRQVKQLS